MYSNFICYRGGSSGGIQTAGDIFRALAPKRATVGDTYFSPDSENYADVRNFLTDPAKHMSTVENFIILLTKDFFEGFLLDGAPNPYSVTRMELDEALKYSSVRFIPVVFGDFSWSSQTEGVSNQDIVLTLWGEEAKNRIVGAMPIPYVFQYRERVIELLISEISKLKASKRVVVFDFDGTLTRPDPDRLNTWEILWSALGYPISECEKYHRQFSNGLISHDEWCEITERRFIEAGCSRSHLQQAAAGVQLCEDTREVILELRSKGMLLYILSGSIKQYIETVIGKELTHCFNEIKANRFVFDSQGLLEGIIGTPYDFEGKARFVKKIMEDKGVAPGEIIYIGNSFNDEFVYTTGVETLCINPTGTDFYNNKVWHNYIRRLTSLKEVLPYIYS